MTDDTKTGARKLTKLLRRDIRSKVKTLAERAQILSLIDPTFAEQTSPLGLDAAMKEVMGDGSNLKPTSETLAGLQKKGEGKPAPLKSFRRQLRQEFAALLEEAQLLRQLDPAFGDELNRLGLTGQLDKY